MKPITQIAKHLNLKDIELYGNYKAKINFEKIKKKGSGKLILVTAMTPTPHGEGKTTITIGLGEALAQLKKKAIVCLREPSLGPVFGMKGGATGGGCAEVEPEDDINLHFTGDFHAVTAANNLIAAAIDNHIFQGNRLKISRVAWKRCIDMNDRALREILISPAGKLAKFSYRAGFDITAASELMAILCLAKDASDLRKRIEKTIIAYDTESAPITIKQLKMAGAAAALLKDAIKPNLVQTTEHTPAFVHGGPFANIAHGCSSLIATKTALKLADYIVTEAGFGTELGAEKFFSIKCRAGNMQPSAVVLVATVKALKHHGGEENFEKENTEAVTRGLENLKKHIENIQKFNIPLVVAVNKFSHDTKKELDAVRLCCNEYGVKIILTEVFNRCGPGGIALAKEVLKLTEKRARMAFLYGLKDTLTKKIETIAKEMYGASSVSYTKDAEQDIRQIHKLSCQSLPICMAKTQNSLSDNPKLLGRPRDFEVTVKKIEIKAGAGFLVVYLGNIMTMPGLPKHPAAEHIDVKGGRIIGMS